jgi:hypothetical protein
MSGLLTPEFVSMIVGVVVSLIIALIPQFESVKVELIAVVTVLIGLVIAALGGERVAAARSSGSTQAERLTAKSESLRVKQ